jgi:hypothetical protein
MVEKYVEEQFVHSMPFKIKKGDEIVFADVKVFKTVHPLVTEVVIDDAKYVGYVRDGKTTVYPLGDGQEGYFCVRYKATREPVDGIVGAVTWLETEPTVAELRVQLLKDSPVGEYMIVAKIRTKSGEELQSVEELKVKEP